MKKPLTILILAGSLALSGCQNLTTAGSTASIKAALADPNVDAKAAQAVTAAVANRILAKNPSYQGDVIALADSFTALAQSNPNVLTGTDVQSLLSKTKIDPAMQGEFVSDFNTVQGLLLTDFNVSLPTLKPIYGLFLQAVANGLYIACGKPGLKLPVVAIPDATAGPAPATAGP